MNDEFTLSVTEAKELLNNYVANKCCARNKPLDKIIITSIDIRHGYRYTIASFAEKSETKWKHTPYTGCLIDDTKNGSLPDKWANRVDKPNLFEKFKEKYRVPQSEHVKVCDMSDGCGMISCANCCGGGNWVRRRSVDANGNYTYSRSFEQCTLCGATGRVRCYNCLGTGQLKLYLQLKVNWNSYQLECIFNELMEKFPNKIVNKALKMSFGVD